MTTDSQPYRAALEVAVREAISWLDGMPTRSVHPHKDPDEIRESFHDSLADVGIPPTEVIQRLAQLGEPGLMGKGSGRFFGWVIGGTLPAALGADWLVSAWDQNSRANYLSPTAVTLEEIAGEWLLDLLHLPKESAVGFPTGGTMANFSGLMCARYKLLKDLGWDVNEKGVNGAPAIRVLVGQDRHVSVDLALRYLGFGLPTVVEDDHEGRIDIAALRKVFEGNDIPTILCLQAGNVHSGSFDNFAEAIEIARQHHSWVHVDGAFGLWALASAEFDSITSGLNLADSWATDAHKTLNVPYDCGISIVKDSQVSKGAFTVDAGYLFDYAVPHLQPSDKVVEFSRRARGVPVWAALQSLGRTGVVSLVEGLVHHAQWLAQELLTIPGCQILNDVVFTQVCFAFESDERTLAVGNALMANDAVWISGSHWKEKQVLRISVSNWSTDQEDLERTIAAVRQASHN
jgi:glutamate/tyrosine decarboxylase-like PLP-dependent enzyme